VIPVPVRGNEATVQCGSCTACCYQAVVLMDEEHGYEAESIPTPDGVLLLLKRRDDGACVYLTEDGCSIHDARPACCRVFHCGRWYARLTPGMRKEMLRRGDANDRRMLKAGKRRAGP
jgi:Fe-S-cluster containining protein